MMDNIGPNLSHPAALTRLTSTVLRFRCPNISSASQKLSYVNSFRTVGKHDTTFKAFKEADSNRNHLIKALSSSKSKQVSHESIALAASRYIPNINQILVTCRVQPENAQLDKRLVFEWSSGIEAKPRFFKSEALMYELVMAIATETMATAGHGTDECTKGDFKSACVEFKKVAGMMDFLATEQLPQWLSKKDVADDSLPAEAKIGTCEAFKELYLGIAQQMAVATVLNKKDKPTWSMLAKLGLGISEQMSKFVSILRSKEALVKSKIDPNFFVLMTFQIELQKSLSMYYHARHYWEVRDFGIAIALLSKSIKGLQFRETPTGRGLPPITKGSPLRAVEKDLAEVKKHMDSVLFEWEKDNSKIYFETVPKTIPVEKKLDQGTLLMKPQEYKLEDVELLPLILPEDDAERLKNSKIESDAELAKKLQEQELSGE
mmetsp:Transcript_23603/g.26916  ORF Transcript_23603/g.26916 Transcript_23603/m.26916 type:complete len:433 (+) Transcript_23603:63-1361(+)